jgi:SAM-dependent methyltransferase
MLLDPFDIDTEKYADFLDKHISDSRIFTLNNRGYVFTHLSPIADKFLHEEASANKDLLEIGAGFSSVALNALKRGVNSYTANDMQIEHLEILVAKIKSDLEVCRSLKKLKLILCDASDLTDIEFKYDAILIDKVIHFLNPQQIEQLFKWIKKVLKNNGRLYIFTLSPYRKFICEKLIPIYQENLAKGDLYPGYVADITSYLSKECLIQRPIYFDKDGNYLGVKQSTLFMINELKYLCEIHGFTVVETIAVTETIDDKWQEIEEQQSSFSGLICSLKK